MKDLLGALLVEKATGTEWAVVDAIRSGMHPNCPVTELLLMNETQLRKVNARDLALGYVRAVKA